MHDGRFEYLKEVIGHYTDGIAALPNLGKELTSGCRSRLQSRKI